MSDDDADYYMSNPDKISDPDVLKENLSDREFGKAYKRAGKNKTKVISRLMDPDLNISVEEWEAHNNGMDDGHLEDKLASAGEVVYVRNVGEPTVPSDPVAIKIMEAAEAPHRRGNLIMSEVLEHSSDAIALNNQMLEVGTLTAGELAQAAAFRKLNKSIPLNTSGLPEYTFRTDLIPVNLYDNEAYNDVDRMRILDGAALRWEYFDGYPTFENGTAVWHKMDFEPSEAYQAFQQYLDFVQDESGMFELATRSFESIALNTGIPLTRLRLYAHTYFWEHRGRAFDFYKAAEQIRRQHKRRNFVQDDEYGRFSAWMSAAEARMAAIFDDEDLLEEMKPSEVFKMYTELAKMRRVSAGLPANGPAEQVIVEETMEVTMAKVTAAAGQSSNKGEDDAIDTQTLLDDPDNLQAIQEMVLRQQSHVSRTRTSRGQ